MAEYLHPGVYVEEIDAGPKPIEGVSTSTAGAVGVTERGPTDDGPPYYGKPVLVTSFADFERKFGGFLPAPEAALANRWDLDFAEGGRWWQFPLSVKGFFDNGGQRLYVKRVFARPDPVAGTGAVASRAELGQGLVAAIAADAGTGDIRIRLQHTIRVQIGSQLQLFTSGATALPGNPYAVQAYDSAGNVTLDAPLRGDLRAGRDVAVIAVRSASLVPANQVTLRLSARSLGAWGDGVGVRVRPMVGATLSIQADPLTSGAPATTQLTATATNGDRVLQVEDSTGFAAGDHVRILGREFRATAVAVGQLTIEPPVGAPETWPRDTSIELLPLTTQLTAPVTNSANLVVQDTTGFATGWRVRILGRAFAVTVVDATHMTVAPPVGAAETWPAGTSIELLPVTTQLTAPATNSPNLVVQDTAGFATGRHVRILGREFTITVVDATHMTVAPPVGAAVTWPAGTSIELLPLTTQLTAPATNSPNLVVQDTTGFATGKHVRVLGREFTVTVVDATHLTIAPPVGGPATWEVGTYIARMRPAGSGTRMHLANASGLYDRAVLEFDNGVAKETVIVDEGGVVGNVVTFAPALANTYFEGHKARVIEMEIATRYQDKDGRITAQELFQNLRLHDDQSTSFVQRAIYLQSTLIRADTVPPASGGGYSETNLTLFPTSPREEWVDLRGGDDATDDLTVDDFVGHDGGSGHRTGIQALEDIEEISLVAAPGMWSETVTSALIRHCEQLRYRFAVIDPRDGLSIQGVRDFRDAIDTKYAALYYPWIEVRDPSARRNVVVAPSLHMLGLYARVDVDRGVHKAPANEVIGGITRIAQEVNQREQDMLNPKGINALRFFPGRGNRVWGARTLSSDGSWKYVNVRRIFIYVEASIDRGTQWVVFEPNDEPLWARVRATITNFLTTTWRSGMLQGTTPEEAFFVKVDRSTMTQDDIDNGRLICVIGIAPVKPAEFVIFRIQQKTLEANPS